jgi:hypothetical protein
LAAPAERCASVRTSDATTETAALLAGTRRFHRRIQRQDIGLEGDAVDDRNDVHGNLARRFGDRAHGLHHATPRCRPAPPPTTRDRQLVGWRALSAFCFTVEVSSSIDDAVSSASWPAVGTADRSALPEAISCEAVAISSVPLRTSPTVLARLSFMSFSACSSSLVSSPFNEDVRGQVAARHFLRHITAPDSGPVIERVITAAHHAGATATPPSTNSTIIRLRSAVTEPSITSL